MGTIIRSVFGWILQAVVFTVIADVVGAYLRRARERAIEQGRIAEHNRATQ